MAIVNRDEFAAICNMSRNSVNTYVVRQKIEVRDDKLIDTETPLNKIFIKLRRKFEKKPTVRKVKKVVEQVVEKESEVSTEKPEKAKKKRSSKSEDDLIDNFAFRKLKAETEKAERDNELKQLQLEKMMGQLIPVDLMHGIFKINIQNIFMSFENELVNIASIYCDILAGGDRGKLSEIIDLMRQNLSRIIEDTKTNAAKEIEGTINEYSETRSRGERQ